MRVLIREEVRTRESYKRLPQWSSDTQLGSLFRLLFPHKNSDEVRPSMTMVHLDAKVFLIA
jgi:hypothetical protein